MKSYQCTDCQQLDKTIRKGYRNKRAIERRPPPFGTTASPIRLYEPGTPVVASPVAVVLDRFDSLDASVAVSPAIVRSVVNQINHLSQNLLRS